MLCLDCSNRPLPEPGAQPAASVLKEGISRLGNLYCAACGSLLPLTDSVDGMMSKLVQLDRFGLSAFAAPLLRRARRAPIIRT